MRSITDQHDAAMEPLIAGLCGEQVWPRLHEGQAVFRENDVVFETMLRHYPFHNE